MKRIYTSNAVKCGLLFWSALLLSSCSSLWSHRDQGADQALSGSEPHLTGTVPREQYDELARKYQELLGQSKNLKAADEVVNVPFNVNEQKNIEAVEATHLDPSELVNRIDNALPDLKDSDPLIAKEKAEIENKTGVKEAKLTSQGVETVNNTDEIDGQITKLREAQTLVKVNKYDQALTILKELEESKEKQIVVRAKIMLGDLLFNQGEYDLSSQVYEEIVSKYAFSGFVLNALRKLIVCSEKLKQPEKQAKYYSLLHDFFEAG